MSDESAAESNLFRVLADQDIVVTEYGRKKYELEEIFLNIVEGKNNG